MPTRRVREFVPTPMTSAESDAMVDICQRHNEERGFTFRAVERRDTGAFVGMAGLSIPGDARWQALTLQQGQ